MKKEEGIRGTEAKGEGEVGYPGEAGRVEGRSETR
jgi:hypothetical protein